MIRTLESLRLFFNKTFLTPTDAFEIIPITADILEGAAELRAVTSLKLPDAVHVATASQEQCTSLLTNDISLVSTPRCRIIQLSEVVLAD
ncbi:MAG: PIN domain-containing protein [Candidatus Hydrogenedentes bacterium]|nr:PIN domain-containing protein [Candidatus Hydrogenedentota bacterium]